MLQTMTPTDMYCSFNKLVCFGIFTLSIISTVTSAKVKLPANVTVSAVIVFGDSIVDPGNNNNRLSLAKANHPPYGRDFMGGIATGRFSNGKITSDMIAEALGVKSLVPAYMDPNLMDSDLPTGVNFASGAAGYDPLTSTIGGGISLYDQVQLFEDYIAKLHNLVGEEKTTSILNNAVYLVALGSNDIVNTYFGLRVRQSQYTIDGYSTLMIDHGTTFLKQIYALGARKVSVFGAAPLGCIPSQRTLAGGSQRACSNAINEFSKLYNSKLDSSLTSLTRSLPNARFGYIDNYNTLLDIIQNYQSYGFEVANLGCCGTGTIEVIGLCTKNTPHTCPDASKYVFWDSFHPTERAYKIITKKLLSANLKEMIN